MKTIIFLLLFLTVQTQFCSAAEESVNELAAKGSEAFAREDFDKAHNLYGKALELEPGKAALLYNQANVLYRQEKYEEAFALYRKAIKTGPSRELQSSIYFNSGNTALQLANMQIAEKQEITDLKKALEYFEQSFEMYRNSIEHARAVSIAQGRNVQEAGLYARQNWALARESWTQTWEKIREIEKKNLQLEDGVSALLQAQSDLLPTLERMYLNSFSEDVLNFNLKKLAEYHLDYHADIVNITEMATGEEEKLQAELDNLKANQSAANTGQQPDSEPDSSTIMAQLEAAGEIKNAVQQASAYGEWVVDGLKRGDPIQAWQNSRQMIDLLQSLVSYLNKSDPALASYQSLVMELGETENLLIQAAGFSEMEESEVLKSAAQKRTTLAQAKSAAALATVGKINLLLEQLKSSQQEGADEIAEEPGLASGNDNIAKHGETTDAVEESQQTATDLLEETAKQLITVSIDELLAKNNTIVQEIKDTDFTLENETAHSVSEQLSEARTALLWYQHLQLPVTQIIASLIKDTETVIDQIRTALDETADDSGVNGNLQDEQTSIQSEDLPNGEQVNILLFQLENVILLISKQQSKNIDKETVALLTGKLQEGLKSLNTAWGSFQKYRSKKKTSAEKVALSKATSSLRYVLFRNLLVFSPETAIGLYYERAKGKHQQLAELLPARADNMAALGKEYANVSQEAGGLKSLLEQYFSGLEDSIAKLDNQEKQAAFASSIPQRRESVQFVQRFLDAGLDATKLLKEQKFQQAELLFKDMANSIDKSRMAFAEQPQESLEIFTLAIELQKKIEEQSRSANEAAAIEGNPARIIRYIADNQTDIKKVADHSVEAIQQMIGMSQVPTHGQENQPQSDPNQQVDSAKLEEAIDKVGIAQVEMGKIETFIRASEFHNTLTKHQEVIDLLQEALDLLKNDPGEDDKQKGEDGQDEKQEGEQQGQDGQQNPPVDQQQNGDQQGSSRPKKPLELGPQEARDLLQQLNQQDEKQQGKKAQALGEKSFNTPRPW